MKYAKHVYAFKMHIMCYKYIQINPVGRLVFKFSTNTSKSLQIQNKQKNKAIFSVINNFITKYVHVFNVFIHVT